MSLLQILRHKKEEETAFRSVSPHFFVCPTEIEPTLFKQLILILAPITNPRPALPDGNLVWSLLFGLWGRGEGDWCG